MATTIQTTEREAILVEDAHIRPMMGLEVLEPVPARNVPYELSDPYILVHEAPASAPTPCGPVGRRSRSSARALH